MLGQGGTLGPISLQQCNELANDLAARSEAFFRVVVVNDAEKSIIEDAYPISGNKSLESELQAIRDLNKRCIELYNKSSVAHIIVNFSKLNHVANASNLEAPFDKLNNIKRTAFIITISRQDAPTGKKMGLSLGLGSLTSHKQLNLNQNKHCQFDCEDELNMEEFLDKIRTRLGVLGS